MISYIPTLHCAKCNKPLVYGKDFKRRMTGLEAKQRRFIEVTCHGEKQEVGFRDAPKQQVVLWPSPAAPPSSSSAPPPTTR